MNITDSDRTDAVTAALQLVTDGATSNKASATVGKQHGVTGRTIQIWAKKAGTPLGDASHEAAKKARDAARIQYQASREQLKVRMTKLAHDVIDRCYAPHYEYMGKDAVRVDYETARSGDIKNYVTSAAILIDKCRLEEGKATERHESLNVGAVEAWLSEQERELSINDG